MAQDQREMLEFLNFELKFLEDGGYGRSPRTPWRTECVRGLTELSQLCRSRQAAFVQ